MIPVRINSEIITSHNIDGIEFIDGFDYLALKNTDILIKMEDCLDDEYLPSTVPESDGIFYGKLLFSDNPTVDEIRVIYRLLDYIKCERSYDVSISSFVHDWVFELHMKDATLTDVNELDVVYTGYINDVCVRHTSNTIGSILYIKPYKNHTGDVFYIDSVSGLVFDRITLHLGDD